MPLIAPLALAGLAFIPLVVAFYLLRLRREEAVVPSTLLWQRLVADVEANAPWQRLRRTLLLLLQLLLVAILAILAARPFMERPAGLARDLVIVVDTSASMAATDVEPNRLEAAKAAIVEALRDLPSGGRVSIVAAAGSARVVANATSDSGRIRQALDSLEVTNQAGDLGDGLRLAAALAARSADAEVLVATDAALTSPPEGRIDAPVRVLRVGRDAHNQAIVALAVRADPSSVTRSVFISIVNTDLEQVERRIELWGDGRLLEARDVYLDPQARSDLSIDDIPRDVRAVEVRLRSGGDEGADESPLADRLAVDDRAWAVVPPDRRHRILLVSEGDPYLQTALSYLPQSELYGVKPADYGPATHPELFDLIIFEGVALPAELPKSAILAIAPPSTSLLGKVGGTLSEPAIVAPRPDEPLLKYVDLSTVHIAAAQKLSLPDWARTVIAGPGGAPLLYAGTRPNGLRAAVLAFEPRRSDLPLQVAFPLLISNLAGELLGGGSGPNEAIAPGAPVELPIASGASGLRITLPDGTSTDVLPETREAKSVTFDGTSQLGVYSAVSIGGAPAEVSPGGSSAGASSGTSPAPLGSPTSVPSGALSSSPAGDASGSAGTTAPPVDPNAPIQFAVDLFSVSEAAIAPGPVGQIERLGTTAGAPGSPGPSGSSGGSAPSAGPVTAAGVSARPPARDELWGPILLIVLVLLSLEWAVYNRDAVVRMRRGIASRIRLPGRRL